MNHKATVWLAGLFAAVLVCSGAQASTVVLDDQTLLVLGSQPAVTPLSVPGAGELSVTLTDLQFQTAFASLQFALTEASSSMTPLSNAGTQSLDLTAPMTVYANVFAASEPGSSGLYNLTATFVPSSAVPLPASASSLMAGLLMLLVGWYAFSVASGRKPIQATVMTAMA